ncbi:MAG: hypothetical protein A2493_01635 [Candidatus Magasanikbacteria bacterium RIFOXYC12_FULL_33_11]|uniref:Uncharacterized protein n=1 Tax=Candidatus Magasanikbacteria bacterium RIFOXYC12_FULL_33_11 TaxID=1798701 RepID=A0A1F6NLY4_9BACT|nr:MAG: hypothetical protein A2493_01635 [Candidatus Magasanikbacteria bacterium RIFOXYC12_FULL_33_11]
MIEITYLPPNESIKSPKEAKTTEPDLGKFYAEKIGPLKEIEISITDDKIKNKYGTLLLQQLKKDPNIAGYSINARTGNLELYVYEENYKPPYIQSYPNIEITGSIDWLEE